MTRLRPRIIVMHFHHMPEQVSMRSVNPLVHLMQCTSGDYAVLRIVNIKACLIVYGKEEYACRMVAAKLSSACIIRLLFHQPNLGRRVFECVFSVLISLRTIKRK